MYSECVYYGIDGSCSLFKLPCMCGGCTIYGVMQAAKKERDGQRFVDWYKTAWPRWARENATERH